MGENMANATIGQFQVNPGQEDAFLEAARQQAKLASANGARPVLRQSMFAGPNSGNYILLAIYDSAGARAAAIDAMRQEASIPMRDFIRVQGGGVGLGRSWLDEVTPTPSSNLAAECPVSQLFQFRPGQGQGEALQAALAESQPLHEKAGAVVTAWSSAAAGPNSLNLAYSLGFENFVALQTFVDGARTAGPLRRLAQTGALEFVSAGISVRIDL